MTESEHHIACSLTSTLLQRVARAGGDAGVERVLARASTPHSATYLGDVTNWVSYDEAVALFDAAVEVTGDAAIPRAAGEETVRQHAGTPVATLFRSLGSPEKILEQVTTAVTKFSVVTEMETLEVEPGRAIVRARSRPGFERHPHLCDWTVGLLSQPTVLFGLPPASVEESECQARGGRHCLYEVCWDPAAALDPSEHVTLLERQLAAMGERVESVLATAADLIADGDLDTVLARITERAATAVRAPRYLLAVRPTAESELHCHYRGLTAEEAEELVSRLDQHGADSPSGLLVAEVRSGLRDYGRLVAVHEMDAGFFAQERELFTLYARYAASVLDRATALADAQHSRDEAQALLALARALAEAGGSDDVAQRIVAALPAVVDCDRSALLLWDGKAGELRAPAEGADQRLRTLCIRPQDTPALRQMLLDPRPERAMYFDEDSDDAFMAELLRKLGDEAAIVVPVAARGTFLGVLALAVDERRERVQPRPELLDRLAGVAAQAATALENGRLIDHITRQALHDPLTDLPNRQLFAERLDEAVAVAARADGSIAVFYVDLDQFKTVNDAYGHAAGDELLRQVAERLALTTRAGDTVARLGGDEFAVLLATVRSPEEIAVVARRVGAVFERPFDIDGESLPVTASVGEAVWPVDADDIEGLLRIADTAMYSVKRDRAAKQLVE